MSARNSNDDGHRSSIPSDGLYVWEKNIQRSWEALEEDERGVLNDTSASREAEDHKSDDEEVSTLVRRGKFEGPSIFQVVNFQGIIRYVYCLLDLSRAMNEVDFRPTRISAVIEILQEFVQAFFDENPLSNFGLLCTRSGLAERITALSSSPNTHINALGSVKTDGDFSLQNGLELAYTCLSSIPQYGYREVIVIQGSLNSCDPSNIFETIKKLSKGSIRCSVIGLSAEVHISKYLSRETKGQYGVARDKEHLRKLIFANIRPPSIIQEKHTSLKTSFIRMGFPTQRATLALCADTRKVSTNAFQCPRCHGINSELPTECKICSLSLIASPHLARSYHHLFPVSRFKSVKVEFDTTCRTCTSILLKGFPARKCPKCEQLFCEACNEFIHDSLHNCPSCLSAGMEIG